MSDRIFPPCPLNLDAVCRMHARVVDLSRAGDFVIEWGDDDANVTTDIEIEWRWRSGDMSVDIGVRSMPPDACICLMTTARGIVVDLIGEDHPCVDDLLRVYGMVKYALGAHGRCVFEVRSPERPAWWPVQKGCVN